MAYSSVQISDILLKADKTMYKLGDVAYENMFDELDEAYDYERDIIFIYKKAVEYGDNYFVGTLKLDQIVERLAAKLNIYDYGTLAPIYVDVYTQVDQGLNIIYVLKTTALDLGPGLTGSTDFSQSQIDIDIDYTYLNNVYVIDERTLTINGVTYDLSSNRTWTLNLDSVTDQGSVTTNSITVGSVYLTNMTAGSGALYYGVGANRLTLANYNAGGSVYIEVNGGQYSAVFGSDLSFTSYGTIAGVFNNATVDTDKFIVSDGGVLKYRTGTQLLSDIGGQGALTLTTTGTSGPATLIANTLNIPNYGAALTGYVPYTGATQDVDLGTYGLIGDFVRFNPSSSNIPSAEGVMSWDNSNGTVSLSLKGNTYNLPIGQSLVARVVNNTGAQLNRTDYRVVRVSSAQGQRLAVSLAQANNDANSADTLGIVCENISNNQEGFVVNVGQITEINTTGSLQGETWADGDSLYLSATTPGVITNIKPVAPSHGVRLGYVEYAHSQHGKIYVKIDNGYELDELHDVEPTPYVNKGVLYRDTTLNLWKSATIQTLLGYTPANQATTLTINGTTYDLSANRTWSVGNITGSGTANQVAFFDTTNNITSESNLYWDATNNKLGIGNSNPDALNSGASNLVIGDGTAANRGLTIYTGSTNDGNIFFANPSSTYAGYIQYSHALGRFTFGLTGGGSMQYGASTGLYLHNIPAATVDTDKFIVNDNGYIKYRTGAQLLSDIGAQAAGSYVTTSRQLTINGTAYDLSADRSWSVGTITSLTGEATGSGTGAVSVTLDNTAVIGKVLTGLNLSGGGTIVSTDSILQAFGKVQNQISALVGGVMYKGVWDANVNSPSLTSSVGNKGDYYIVNVAGSTNLNGITDWRIGDWAIFNGATWDKVDNTDAVSSVNTFTGAVSLTTANIPEVTNLYYLDSRARAALSFTAGSGNYSTSTGVITIPTNTNHLTNGAGFITLTSLSASSPLSYNNLTGGFSIQVANSTQSGYLSSTDWNKFNNNIPAGVPSVGDYVFFNGSNLAYRGIIANSPLSYNSSTATFSISQASGSTDGYLSSSDWTTFNNKQSALTNPVTGTGTTNYLPKFTGSTSIGNSVMAESSSNIGIGTSTPDLSDWSAAANGLQINDDIWAALKLTGSTGKLFIASGAAANYIFGYNAVPLVFGTDNTERMRLTSTGLGIGTTSPGGQLDVYTGTFNRFYTSYPDAYTSRWNLGVNGFIQQDANVQELRIAQSYTGSFSAMTFYMGASERMRLTSSGNLGLGVTPSAWASGYTALQVLNLSLFGTSGLDLNLASNTYYDGTNYKYIDSGYASLYNQYQGKHYWSTAGTSTAGSTISFTQAMTLDASGRLGIGTTSPSYKLDVTGTGYFSSTLTLGGGSRLSAVSGNGLNFNTNGTDRMTLDVNGNLGLGVTPSAWRNIFTAFQVGYTGALYSIATGTAVEQVNLASNYYQDSAGNELRIQAGYATRYQQASGEHRWSTAGTSTAGSGISFTQAMTLDASGRLGIGVTSPAAKLDVLSTANAIKIGSSSTSSNVQLYVTNNNNGDLYLGVAASDGTSVLTGTTAYSAYLGSNLNVPLHLATNGSVRMTLSSTGNVGIGTSSPSFPLEVYNTSDARLASTSTTGLALFYANNTSGRFFFAIDNSSGGGFGNGAYTRNIYSDGAYPMVFTTNSSERMRITSGGNVGIGTTSPSYTLDVNGTGRFSGNVNIGGSGNPTLNIIGSDGAYTGIVNINAAGGGSSKIYGNGGSNTLILGTNNTDILTLGSTGAATFSSSVTAGGQVSINAGNGNQLYLNNSGQRYTQITFANNSSLTLGGLWWDNNESSFEMYATSGGSLRFHSNATERMRITSGGNVGIGTSSPGNKLHVIGNAWINRPSNKVDNNGATEFGSRVEFNNAFSAGSTGYAVFTYPSSSVFRIYADYDGNIGGLQPDIQLGLGYLTVKSSGSAIGNVGIGTTSPSSNLVVNSNGETKVVIQTSNPSGNSDVVLEMNGNYYYNSIIRNNSAGNLVFQTNGTSERMRITSGGNVGIGTTSPGAKLHVYGNLQIYSGTGGYSDALVFGSETGAPKKAIFLENYWMVYQGHDNEGHKFRSVSATGAGTDDMVITGGGNVGIGISAPWTKVDIRGTSASADATLQIVGNGISTLLLGQNSDGGVIRGQGGNNVLSFWTGGSGDTGASSSGSERMRITSGGSLLVGTTSAAFSEKFQVSGAQSSNGLVIIRNDANQADVNHGALVIQNRSPYGIGNDASIGFALEYSGYPHPRASIGAKTASEYGAHLVFNTRSDGSSFSEKMRISAAGNVGIGTSSPQSYTNYRILHLAGQATNGSGLLYMTNSDNSIVGMAFAEGSAQRVTFGSQTNHPVTFLTNDTERMRITSGGALLINGTTQGDGALQVFFNDASSSPLNYGARIVAGRTNNSVAIAFVNPNGVVGSITTDGSFTNYATTSDYRLKEDLKSINGLDIVDKINVYNFKWKSSSDRMDGVLAHELAQVLPYAVVGEKDGKTMQGVDYSKIVPVLVKSIQELKAEIEQLKNK